MRLEIFREYLGPPLYARSIERDWVEVEALVGCDLPLDYKEFVSSYGPSCISDTLLIFHPKAPRGENDLNLFDEIAGVAEQYAELKRSPAYPVPYPIYPDDGGCIPVARTSGGNQVFLLPPGATEVNWSVVVDMGEWVQFPSSFTEFLHGVLSFNLNVPFMQDQDPSFEPVGRLRG